VAPDIKWLLKQGGQYGVGTKLAGKLDYFRRSFTGELSQQNNLFRLTYALEMAKDMCWVYRLLSDREWSGRHAAVLNAAIYGIYLSRTSLDAAFDDDGQRITALMAPLNGQVQWLETLLSCCGWQMPVSGPQKLYELTEEKNDETLTKVKNQGSQ